MYLSTNKFSAWSRRSWNLGDVTACLARHRFTLISIQLGGLCGGRGPTSRLNVVDWPALRTISLHWADIDFDGGTAANSLLAPNLERLTIEFRTEDQHSESWNALNELTARWCQDLLLGALARQARLTRLHVEFNPDPWYSDEVLEPERIQRWPWEWLDDAAEVVRREGSSARLTYSEPAIGKEDYYRSCRGGPQYVDYEEEEDELGSENEGSFDGNEDEDKIDIEAEFRRIGPLTSVEAEQRERFERYFCILH
jgi:hypothetical protein